MIGSPQAAAEAKQREGQESASSPSVDRGLLCLLILARFLGVPVNGDQLRHQFGEPSKTLSDTDLLRAAGHLGLKAGLVRRDRSTLAGTPLPAMARMKDGGCLVVAKIEADKVLVQDPLQPRPAILSRQAFEEQWSGELLLMTTRAGMRPEDRRFDFAWFIPAIVKYRRLLGEVLLGSFFLQVFGLLAPLFTQVVIDKVLVHKGLTTLHVLTIGMIALALFEAVLGGLRTYLFSHTTNRIDVGLGAQLFRHLLTLPLAYFEARRVGDTVARVRELEHIRQFLTSNSVTVVLDLLFTVVFLGVMFFYSTTLTLVVLATIPLYAVLSIVITPVIRARLNEKFNRGAENQSFLVETISGIQTVKAMAVEPPLQRRWEEQLAAYVQASFRATSLITVTGQAASFINRATTIAILWFGAYQVMNGGLSIGQLIAFNMLAGQVTGPMLRIVNLWQEFQQVGVSMQRLGDVLNTTPEPACSPSRTTLPTLAGRVELDRVSFRYRPDGQEVLRKVSLIVEPGQVVGLVGRSGSGKSTITKLVQRLYVPEWGRILVDGVDLAQVDPAWLRRRIGVVLQENFLFNRTVRDNIALADPGISAEAVVRAATLAGAHEFILELPEGYDTVVGEHGCSLSGGQRQRVAIARALVTNPRILIFDEATSALDYESEAIIQRNLADMCRGRTVFIIAHRLGTVRTANHIYVIEKGEVAERGTHEALIRRGGYYAALHKLQENPMAGAPKPVSRVT
jgi:subfamily B ATP-binding cassette protein HlyB/CyaB